MGIVLSAVTSVDVFKLSVPEEQTVNSMDGYCLLCSYFSSEQLSLACGPRPFFLLVCLALITLIHDHYQWLNTTSSVLALALGHGD
jgi:hypothetical protein